jgi:Phage virion morphogenesis family
VSANLARMKATLDRHRKLFDLTQDNLGQRLCKAATDGVQACIAGQHEPDGTPWQPLSEHYEEWKAFHYPGLDMGVLHQHMANPHEVAGEVEVYAARAVVTYGISEQARQEAVWFQEGSGRPGHGQPARRFWGFTADSLEAVKAILGDRLKSA